MKLPLLSGRQILAALTRLGSVELHRRGSHVKMKHPDGRVIIVPFHDEVDRFTLKGALVAHLGDSAASHRSRQVRQKRPRRSF